MSVPSSRWDWAIRVSASQCRLGASVPEQYPAIIARVQSVERPVTVRSELIVYEAGIAWLFYGGFLVVFILAAMSSDPFDKRALVLPVLFVWWPLAWSLRRVRVTGKALIEVRFWPFRRSWKVETVEEFALIPRTLGWVSLPATSAGMRVASQDVWFPTLQAWALTRRSLGRAEARVTSLAEAVGVPWSDRTQGSGDV